MSQALVGVIGVAAGALTTGGVQAFLAWRERRANAVASARLMWAEFRAAVVRLQTMLKSNHWEDPLRLESLLKTWETEKHIISRATTNVEFEELVAGTHHASVLIDRKAEGKRFFEVRETAERTTQYCIEARVVAFIAGEPLHRRVMHRLKLRAMSGGVLYEPDVTKHQMGVPSATEASA